MNTRQQLLGVIAQLPDEQLIPLLELAYSLSSPQDSVASPSNLRAFLKLPITERSALLTKQAAMLEEYFQPGAEEMEWAEEYVEDENWDDQ